jgi:hypothetical protein
LFPGPPELGAINPDAVHDHGQPTKFARAIMQLTRQHRRYGRFSARGVDLALGW